MAMIVICDKCGKQLEKHSLYNNIKFKVLTDRSPYPEFAEQSYQLCDKCMAKVYNLIRNESEKENE